MIKNIKKIEVLLNTTLVEIPSFSKYAISTNGDVFNLLTMHKLKAYNSISKIKFLTKKNKTSYKVVKIKNDNGLTMQLTVHKLMILSFSDQDFKNLNEFEIFMKENNFTVDHIDSDKSNNNVYNLQLLTIKDNLKKYYKECYDNFEAAKNERNKDDFILALIKSYKKISKIEQVNKNGFVEVKIFKK